jgi:hypothetical protein
MKIFKGDAQKAKQKEKDKIQEEKKYDELLKETMDENYDIEPEEKDFAGKYASKL